MFTDKAHIIVSGGHGGDGCLSFRREKYVEMGGPDGGNGGRGGDVWLEVDPHKTTLADFAYRPHFKAGSALSGHSANKTGRSGEDLVIRLPPGTMVYREGKLVCDLKNPGERFLAAHGGRGGRGNASFKTSTNTAPRIAEKGETGESAELDLELKLLADVGLVGFPNAGKSTLLSRITKAHPKIADYPFTTLSPNLGVAHVGERSFVVADIPGLIEGAHQGKGLGDEFLRHVERTRVLIHLVDVSGWDGKSAYQNFCAVNKELGAYSERLLQKPQVVAATKMDLTDAEKKRTVFARRLKKTRVHAISAVTGLGLAPLLAAVLKALDKAPDADLFVPAPSALYRLEPDFWVEKEGELFRVRGKGVERLVAMTNFDQDEAIARLQKIFRKMGVEKTLEQKGIAAGDLVAIGDYEFTYKPEPPRRR
ncbi:MAG TPA: GTPase ObgE [Elusimicrobiota bacterium]|nr:GTPase ObgE [Elusimicrobiota bacterium]